MPTKRVSIYPEPYAASGNIGDGGLRKLLGAPSLNMLQMVIREAVQNSCDAAKLGTGPEILIRVRTLTKDQIKTLKETIFCELPINRDSRAGILNFLNSAAPNVLEICDFQTVGLGGPTRADWVPQGTKVTDFIDFMRNFGSNHDTHNRGGTYGFGKVSLYQASKCQTVLVDTCTTNQTEHVRRLMGCHLGLQYEVANKLGQVQRFTGRHWWGNKNTDAFVDPVEGTPATELSLEIGFPKRDKLQTGTSIMILDPFIESSNEIMAGVIQESLLWNFWPRLTSDTPKSKKINFQIEVDGCRFELPSPEDFPPLDLFSIAIKNIRNNSKELIPINAQKASKKLGTLSLIKGMKGARTSMRLGENSIIPFASAHIAVMRPVELVVKYIEGAFLPDERLEWAGVFIADEQVESAFAKAEPPAHDDWQPKIIDDATQKSYVTIALRRIKEEAMQFSSPLSNIDKAGTNGKSLAAAAGAIGNILSKIDGQGGGSRHTGSTGGKKNYGNSATNPVFIKLESSNSKIFAIFETQVKLIDNAKPMKLHAFAHLAADGSAFTEDSLITTKPKISTIKHKEFVSIISKADELEIGTIEGTYEIRVQLPRGYATTLKVELSEVTS